MCQIQFIKKLNGKKLTKKDIEDFVEFMNIGSYHNADAWGLFNDKYSVRNPGAFYNVRDKVINRFSKTIYNNNSDFIIGHNRFATKGEKGKNINNHPFTTKDIVLVHNGVLSNDDELRKDYGLNYSGEVDSLVIINLIQMFYSQGYEEVDCVKKTAELLLGRFSCFAYFKNSENIYYFKNQSADFSFALDEKTGTIYGSTDEDNFADILSTTIYGCFDKPLNNLLIFEPKGNIVYQVNNEGIFKKATFTSATYTSTNNYSGYHNTTNNDQALISLFNGQEEYDDEYYSELDKKEDIVALVEDIHEKVNWVTNTKADVSVNYIDKTVIFTIQDFKTIRTYFEDNYLAEPTSTGFKVYFDDLYEFRETLADLYLI